MTETSRRTMTETRKKVYLNLPARVHRLTRVGAAALGVTMSEYVSCLVLEDAVRRGIDAFVRESGAEQVGDGGEEDVVVPRAV